MVAVELCLRDGRVRLSVRDNGVGLPGRAYAARQPFGLLGMQERADMLGGKLHLTSTQGGRHLRVHGAAPASAAGYPTAMNELPGAALRLLIVDDHAIVREGLKRVLESTAAGWQVAEADGGFQALDLLRPPGLRPGHRRPLHA